jgi:outer membrane lipoprotein-sorting protein
MKIKSLPGGEIPAVSGQMFRILLSLFIILPAYPAYSTDTLTELIRLQKSIRTMKAEFIQEKHSELLKMPMVSRGTFYFSSPERVVWDYDEGMRIVSDGTKLILYYKELAEADIMDIANLPFVPGGFSIDRLRERYRIEVLETTDRRHHLSLTPITQSKFLMEIIITLDDSATPLEIRITERTRDYTLISFAKAQLNISLPEELFDMKLPAGVKMRKHYHNP